MLFPLSPSLTMFYSPCQTSSTCQPRLLRSPVDGVDGDMNKRLLPIQVSAANIPTAVRLYVTYGGD